MCNAYVYGGAGSSELPKHAMAEGLDTQKMQDGGDYVLYPYINSINSVLAFGKNNRALEDHTFLLQIQPSSSRPSLS